ncbi:MAG: hypothetical protein MSP08_01850, partial [Clostridiales bacterium]|nr:hypothetical protein [Clostridiales bacterium]
MIEENFKGRSPAETFTGTKIDLTGKGGEESGIEALQVGGFGAVFANEPIGVLIRTSHSGRMGRRKEKGNVVECSGDFFVFGKLLQYNLRQSILESDWFVFPWKCWLFHRLHGIVLVFQGTDRRWIYGCCKSKTHCKALP